jgi:hypothetical protein
MFCSKTKYIGHVDVTAPGGGLQVVYDLDDPFVCDETHWAFENDVPETANGNIWITDKFMTKSGNPKVGQFPYEDGDTASGVSLPVFIGIQGECRPTEFMEGWDCDPVALSLPATTVTMTVINDKGANPYGDIPSTFDLLIAGIVGDFDVGNGYYDGWCVDPCTGIDNNIPYTGMTLYASTGTVPASLSSISWSKINYIMNNYYGENWQSVQGAIWHYVVGFIPDGEVCGSTFDGFDTALAAEIIADADANGGSFIPGCDEWVAVIAYRADLQPVIFFTRQPCECNADTCWAANTQSTTTNGMLQFPGANWFTYIRFPMA